MKPIKTAMTPKYPTAIISNARLKLALKILATFDILVKRLTRIRHQAYNIIHEEALTFWLKEKMKSEKVTSVLLGTFEKRKEARSVLFVSSNQYAYLDEDRLAMLKAFEAEHGIQLKVRTETTTTLNQELLDRIPNVERIIEDAILNEKTVLDSVKRDIRSKRHPVILKDETAEFVTPPMNELKALVHGDIALAREVVKLTGAKFNLRMVEATDVPDKELSLEQLMNGFKDVTQLNVVPARRKTVA